MASESPSTQQARFPTVRYRAPQASGEYFCLPEWPSLPQLVADNQALLTEANQQFFGLDLNALRKSAREQCLQAAIRHTRRYADVAELKNQAPLIVTGHQPALFHPGVWLKNFTAAQLAGSVNGTALNLIIDNDLCPAPSLQVPAGTIKEPRIERVAWDQPSKQIPYEERTVQDVALWQSLPERVSRTIAPLIDQPLVETWWPSLEESVKPNNAGAVISQARHLMEFGWGSHILDLPQSKVCQTEAFRTFFSSLIQHLPVFATAYNGALTDYRRVHRLKNHAQPLPNLEREGDWLECPFWIWTRKDSQRRPLFARKIADSWELTDRRQWTETLFGADSTDPIKQVSQLAAWESEGVKIRSRALTTTLFARWFLADLFIHGIGGGKYDQVTDEIARRLLRTNAPRYAVLSGTLQLPIEHPSVSELEIREKKKRLRDFQFHGETHINAQALSNPDQEKYAQALETKQLAISSPEAFESAYARHQHIEKANQTFQKLLDKNRKQTEHELQEIFAQRRANQVLDSREYAFCLFPREVLQKFLLDFRPPIS